jgi:hypothetical protein
MADITSRRQQTKIAFALLFQLNEPGYILCQNTKDSLLKKLTAKLENMLLCSNLYKLAQNLSLR